MPPSLLSRIKEFFVLTWIYSKVKLFNFLEYLSVIKNYYSNLKFFKIDVRLLLSYFFINPYRLHKQFLIGQGEEEIYAYGETPLTSLEEIARQCHLSSGDCLFELGCGRGRTCFWLNQFIGCRVVGVENTPLFVQKAQQIQERFRIEGVSFRLEDLFETDLQGATAIYLYGTCLSDDSIHRLIERFSPLPKGTKIVTVSYALVDYQPNAPFQLLKEFSLPFPWGKGDVYLQVRD